MAFSMLKKAAATSAAAPTTPAPVATPAPEPTPAPAPVKTVQATVVTPVTKAKPAAPAPTPATAWVVGVGASNFSLTLAKPNRVLAIMAASQSDGGAFVEPLPVLILKGGNAGGTVSPSKGVPAEIASQLPQGKQPMLGQILSYRLVAQSWPKSFDDRTDEDRPMIDCAIPPADADLAAMVMKGAENFQFCPRDQKTKWMRDAGGPGSLRPYLEVLVYWPVADDVLILRTCPLLKTVTTMAQQIATLCDADGNLIQQPVFFEPVTAEWYENNVYHYWKMTTQVNDKGKECHEAHAAWHAKVAEARPDLVQTMMDWFTGADKPCTDAHRELIAKAVSMVNPRRAK